MKDSLQWAYPTLGHQDLCQVNFGTGIAEVLTSFEFFHTRDIAGSVGVRGPHRGSPDGGAHPRLQ
jgi:hypothetical protein